LLRSDLFSFSSFRSLDEDQECLPFLFRVRSTTATPLLNYLFLSLVFLLVPFFFPYIYDPPNFLWFLLIFLFPLVPVYFLYFLVLLHNQFLPRARVLFPYGVPFFAHGFFSFMPRFFSGFFTKHVGDPSNRSPFPSFLYDNVSMVPPFAAQSPLGSFFFSFQIQVRAVPLFRNSTFNQRFPQFIEGGTEISSFHPFFRLLSFPSQPVFSLLSRFVPKID